MSETKFSEMSGTKVVLMISLAILLSTAVMKGVEYAWNNRNVEER